MYLTRLQRRQHPAGAEYLAWLRGHEIATGEHQVFFLLLRDNEMASDGTV